MPKTVKVIIIDTGAPKGEAGRSFVGDDPDPRDRNGHATNVAEVISSRAPEAQLVFFKAVPKSGHGSPNDLANALFAAAAERPDIVNVSLAVPRGEPRIHRAVKALRSGGALVVCGAGNDPAKGVQWPARYPETISVGALGSDGRVAPFSPAGCDLMLKGVRVPVRVRGHGKAPLSGTSIACAVASGLLASAMASGTPDALETIRNSLQTERGNMGLKSQIELLIDKWLKKLLNGRSAALAALMMLSGCTAYDDMDDREWHDFVAARVAYMTNQLAQASAITGNPVAQAEAGGTKATIAGADAVSFDLLQWCYGGFKGGNAVAVDGCTISGLQVSSSRMSYKWEGGGCEQLGASSRTAADCIAALFVRGSDNQWRGGKFDWISTSRTTRSFSNVKSGYHGWPQNAVESATAYAFVIVSRDGRLRTNVIVQER